MAPQGFTGGRTAINFSWICALRRENTKSALMHRLKLRTRMCRLNSPIPKSVGVMIWALSELLQRMPDHAKEAMMYRIAMRERDPEGFIADWKKGNVEHEQRTGGK